MNYSTQNRLKTGILAWAVVLIVTSIGVISPRSAAAQGRPPILLYHHVDHGRGEWHVTPAKFEQQLVYLSQNNYHTVSMVAYMDAINNSASLPSDPVVLTFDDSYSDHFDTIFPLLQKYGFTGTFFVITGRVGTPGYLTWDQIARMQAAGMEIGAHTVHHPFLSKLSPLHALVEIAGSRVDILTHLGKLPDFFAYPYNDRSALTENLARLVGFRAALAVSPHTKDVPGDPFTMPRSTITSGEGRRTFALILKRGE